MKQWGLFLSSSATVSCFDTELWLLSVLSFCMFSQCSHGFPPTSQTLTSRWIGYAKFPVGVGVCIWLVFCNRLASHLVYSHIMSSSS